MHLKYCRYRLREACFHRVLLANKGAQICHQYCLFLFSPFISHLTAASYWVKLRKNTDISFYNVLPIIISKMNCCHKGTCACCVSLPSPGKNTGDRWGQQLLFVRVCGCQRRLCFNAPVTLWKGVKMCVQWSRGECKAANSSYQHAQSLSVNSSENYLLCSHMSSTGYYLRFALQRCLGKFWPASEVCVLTCVFLVVMAKKRREKKRENPELQCFFRDLLPLCLYNLLLTFLQRFIKNLMYISQ